MKNFLLQIWYKLQRKLTGSVPLDHYDIQEEEQFSEEQYRESVQEAKRRMAEESKAKKNREVEFVWSLVGNITLNSTANIYIYPKILTRGSTITGPKLNPH
jgi:hypothetical protein